MTKKKFRAVKQNSEKIEETSQKLRRCVISKDFCKKVNKFLNNNC